MTQQAARSVPVPGPGRWTQLTLGVLCMIMIANLQYGWTLFVAPMQQAHGWKVAEIQVAFAIFIALETWLTPVAGWIVDGLGPRRGPKLVIFAGGIMVGLSGVMSAAAESLSVLYAAAAIAGIGAGGIYAVCVGNAVKWFADRRGLAVGITAAGFGAGAALTVLPIQALISGRGYQAAFLWSGLAEGLVLVVAAWFLRAPLPGEATAAQGARRAAGAEHSFTPRQMLASGTFWLLYLMFVLIASSGLMATAQIAVIAKSFGVADRVLFLGASTLTVALIFDNVMNGAARPFFGWVSDHIGREVTMAIAFTLGAGAYWLLGALGTEPWLFVLAAGLIFFTWGEIFSLFPSTCTDTFGPRYATVNTSLLYTAKGTAALLVPLANLAVQAWGGWHTVFTITGLANLLVGLLAVTALPALRRRVRPAGEAASAVVPRPAGRGVAGADAVAKPAD